MNPIFRQCVRCSGFEYDKSKHLFRVHILIRVVRLLPSIPFYYVLSFSLTANGSGLCEVAELEVQMFMLVQKLIRIPNVQI